MTECVLNSVFTPFDSDTNRISHKIMIFFLRTLPLTTLFTFIWLMALLLCLSQSVIAGTEQQISENLEKDSQAASKQQNIPPKVKIIINGIDDELKDNALAYLELRKSRKNPHFSVPWLRKLHKKADTNISDALQPFGYYQVIVTSSLEQKEDKSWLAKYTVDKGEAVKIKLIDIVITGPAKEDTNVSQAIDDFPIKSGDTLNHDHYETAKSDLIVAIARMGYSKITIQEKEVIVDPQKNTADLHLHLQSGIKYYLGDFIFHQDFLNEEFILTYLQNVKPGDPHSKDKLLEIQNSLLSSGYFSKVDVEAGYEKVNTEQQIPVDIFLKPSKRHKFSVGAGYDTQIEANFSLRWQHRRINRYGHNSDVTSKFSPKKSYIRGSYWMPTGNPHTDRYGLIAKYETEDTSTTDRDTSDLRAGYWFERKEWEISLFTEYKFERFTIGDDPREETQLVSLALGAEKVNFEKKLFPRKGWEFTGQIRLASEALASDISYFRLYLKSRVLFPIGENGRLNLRGEAGFADVSDFKLYPSSLRFYAGGDQSVRGYKWQALGPVDDNGEVTGGKNVLTSTIEYDHKVSDKWVAAGFLDAGNAYNDTLEKVFIGTGFGVRYILPVGLARADVGFPLTSDKDISTDSFVLYFGFEVTL